MRPSSSLRRRFAASRSGAVGGEDQPALDLELADDQRRVPLPRLEVGRAPEPVRRRGDQRHEQEREDEEEAADLRVHPRSPRFTRSETMRRSASTMKLATMLEPP